MERKLKKKLQAVVEAIHGNQRFNEQFHKGFGLALNKAEYEAIKEIIPGINKKPLGEKGLRSSQYLFTADELNDLGPRIEAILKEES